MKNCLNLAALCVAILVLGILHLTYTILDMALALVKKAIGLLPYRFALCIIKMVGLESRSTRVKKHSKRNTEQNRNFYNKH